MPKTEDELWTFCLVSKTFERTGWESVWNVAVEINLLYFQVSTAVYLESMQDQVWIYPAELAPGWSPGYTLQPFLSVNEIVQEDFF